MMARFRCCGNHSTAGHAAGCSLRPPDYKPPPPRFQKPAEREEEEQGCQFDILHFEHIGTCKGTCEETAHFQDPNSLTIIVVEIDPNDERAEEKMKALEERGFHRLNDEELREIISKYESGELQVEVVTMTLDEVERKSRPVDPYLTVGESAELLGFSKGWVRTLAARGTFVGAIKLAHKWAIPRSAILLPD